jgi:hypothetical protein
LPIDRCWANDGVFDCGNLYIEERSSTSLSAWENVTRLHRKKYLNGQEIFPGACMAGQLTSYGYNQHLVNGAQLKSTYSSFLPHQITPSAMYLRSTDVPRTLQSAQAILRGIYPWYNALNQTQILDVYTVDAAREYLYPNPGNCPQLAQYEAAAKNSVAYQSWISTVLQPLMAQAATYYGIPVTSMPSPIAVFDCLSAHRCHGYPLPGNMPDSLYNQVVAAMEWEYHYTYNFPDRVTYGRLAMGQIYYEVLNNFINAIQSKSSNKFVLLSAHDTSVMPFLNAIGAWDGIWAPYASLVQMELWVSHQGESPLIRWIYNRKTLTLPGCSGEFCPLNDFINQITPILLKDPVTACNLANARPKTNYGVYTNDGW